MSLTSTIRWWISLCPHLHSCMICLTMSLVLSVLPKKKSLHMRHRDGSRGGLWYFSGKPVLLSYFDWFPIFWLCIYIFLHLNAKDLTVCESPLVSGGMFLKIKEKSILALLMIEYWENQVLFEVHMTCIIVCLVSFLPLICQTYMIT